MYHIYYKDVANSDPMWHLFAVDGAPVFPTRESARQYIKEHCSNFTGCITQVRKDRTSA